LKVYNLKRSLKLLLIRYNWFQIKNDILYNYNFLKIMMNFCLVKIGYFIIKNVIFCVISYNHILTGCLPTILSFKYFLKAKKKLYY
jgi:hypothetical protein